MTTTIDSEALNQRLTLISKLLAFQIAGDKSLAEGAPILKRLGFGNAEIADIFGSTPKAVSVRLAESKRSR
jgi:hypothetical protein